MRVAIFFNPWSGRGAGRRSADAAMAALRARGHEVVVEETAPTYDTIALARELERFDRVLVSGGDGAISGLLPSVALSGTPVAMIPTGNESLFARHFGMTRDPDRILQLVERGTTETHRYGIAGDRPFFSMVSVGLDSAVVARVAARRSGVLGTRGYLLPTAAAFALHRDPPLRVTVDAVTRFEGSGYVIVANSPCYARGLNPVPEADSRDEILNGRFIRAPGRLGYVRLLGRLLAKRPLDGSAGGNGDTQSFQGRAIQIESLDGIPYPVQADGDFAATTPCKVELAATPITVLALR